MPAAGQTATTLSGIHPQKNGWHLLQYVNGDVAVVQYENGAWQWGSQVQPAGDVFAMNYLASDVTGLSLALPQYAATLGSTVWATLLSSIDHGFLSNGQPISVNSSGQTLSEPANPVSQQGSEAVASNIIPSPNLGSLLGSLGYLGVWIGVLILLGGAALILIAVRQLGSL